MTLLRKYLILAGALLSVVIAHADPLDDLSITPPQLRGYWESKGNFYVDVDGGGIFLNTPPKDNSNFMNDVGVSGFNGQNNAMANFTTTSTAASFGGKLGYIIDAKPTDSWLGSNLRIEGFGSYFQSGASASGSPFAPVPFTAYWMEGLNGRNDNFIGFASLPNVTEVTNDYFYDAGAAIKSDYSLGKQGEFTLTPSIAFDYSHLGQHFQTNGSGNEGSFSQAEKINTDYYGLKFGFELKANVSKQFGMFLDGGITPMVAYSNYSGQQTVNGGLGLTTSSAGDNADKFTFQGSFDGGFAYDFGPVIFKLSGGFQYWDYAAMVKEAQLPVGSSLLSSPSTQASHLVGDSMLNPEVAASVIIPL